MKNNRFFSYSGIGLASILQAGLGGNLSLPSQPMDHVPAASETQVISRANQTEARGRNALVIPLSSADVTLDGHCSEYSTALTQTYSDEGGGNGTVRVMHDGQYLYVCLNALPGTHSTRNFTVNLDPQGDGASYTWPQPNDYRLWVNILDGNRTSQRGTGQQGQWPEDSTLDPYWDARTIALRSGETGEFRIDLQSFGLTRRGLVFGLGLFHQWVMYQGDDYTWPEGTVWWDQPGTWQPVRLGR
ncbi:MAG: hypothetical protein ACKO6N_24280 [Myxococcota bacterium]